MNPTRLAHVLALAALALPAAAQQLWFSQNDNGSYGNYAAGWPAAVIAFRFTAQSTATIVAAEVFTGNQTPAQHSVEIVMHDPVTGLPGSSVGQPGSWTTTHARCWQGAVFAQPASVVQGTDYWLVWRVGGMFPQHSLSADGNPANVITEMRVSDGSSWFAQSMSAGKFRLFAAYAAGTTSVFGVGKAGQYGVPTIGLSGWPARNSPIDVWLDGAARRQPAVLFLGLPIPTGVPLPFATIYTTSQASLLVTTESLTSPLAGGVSLTLFVPNVPGVVGYPLSLQWAVLDSLAADGFSHTGGATARIQ